MSRAVFPSSTHHDPQNTRQYSSGSCWILDFLQTWKKLQVSCYGGKYSIHRLFALEQYTKTTSLSRILLIIVGTPMPTVVFVLIQESVPLQDPKMGWRENYGFWIRVALLAFVISFMASDQTRFLIDDVVLSWRQSILLSVCASCTLVICATIVAAHIFFPIPFFAFVMAPIFYPLLIISYRIIVGSSIWRKILQHQDQCIRFATFVFVQVMIAVTYPVYEMLFRFAEGSRYQILVIILLPIIKVAAKNIVLRCMAHMEDMVPEAVIYTVDFFNAIYIATCMQSATSAIAIVAMTITDLSQTIIMLYNLHRRTVVISTKLRVIIGNDHEYDMVAAACFLCRNPDKFEKQFRDDVQVNSCFPHILSSEHKSLLEKITQIQSKYHVELNTTVSVSGPHSSNVPRARASNVCSFSVRNGVLDIHQIVPESSFPVSVQSTPSLIKCRLRRNPRSAKRITVLRETLEVLFSIECLVVTTYLEAAIPFFYSAYIVTMTYLPNARYHSEMNNITSDNVGSKVLNLILFGLLQLFSCVLLVAMIKRNCGMKAWFHLAFVQDVQMSLIQGKLLAWVVLTLCFRVVHFGTSWC
ncbi:hypothetical protein PHMEG_0004972 [Phytophthora megakarya]|uniref:Transmembrane protein n=1 Tax=Phytophthora megakarya TaxID=4795 RepID=A0A225WSG9_9STRA|nr:hypothetical protein PHMEG_0004972 [Phytophthora megakarya]